VSSKTCSVRRPPSRRHALHTTSIMRRTAGRAASTAGAVCISAARRCCRRSQQHASRCACQPFATARLKADQLQPSRVGTAAGPPQRALRLQRALAADVAPSPPNRDGLRRLLSASLASHLCRCWVPVSNGGGLRTQRGSMSVVRSSSHEPPTARRGASDASRFVAASLARLPEAAGAGVLAGEAGHRRRHTHLPAGARPRRHAGAFCFAHRPVRHSPLAQVAGSEDARVLLVTGSAGFVGFHAAAALRRGGAGVVGLDNFNAYYSVGLKRARAAELEALGVHTVHADLNDGDAVRRSPRLPLAR